MTTPAMNYFSLRGIDSDVYASAELPAWLKVELDTQSRDIQILDFGCGFGQNARAIKSMGFCNVFGADVNQQALEHCRKTDLAVFNVSNGLGQLVAEGNRFDAIISTHVIEHIPKELVIAVLSGLRELLRPGGRLVIAVPNAQAYTGCYWAYEDFTHHTLYTSGSLMYVLRAAGYSNIELIDIRATAGFGLFRRIVRETFSRLYESRYRFWKKMLASPTHISSIDIFTYEVKVRARV